MKTINRMMLGAATLTMLAASAPAMAQPRGELGRWDWSAGDRPYRLAGRGVPILYPELRTTMRGRAFVMRNFDFNHDGRVAPREAAAANRAFADVAGDRRDRFDWDHPQAVIVTPVAGGGFYRGAMADYHFRQTAEGARMTLQEDVLFRTDSAELRPGAVDKLRALAGYLKDNEGVRVSIDGYTDSRGTDAHNQTLSERRAESVRDAFDDLGVTEARFRVRGHGESDPVASNATDGGMRQNRRVEVTLLGQRADSFAR
ncbi:OmpA family protein [Sphingomonas immobilis]|uniref:OmpA family protein n=1 Tax=Sphingomonas immobilis TaxID=3063997 RepID=A0ABT8ZW87_9SPHN|nr:OmpA family protein [Sphingomonas sp. CA1-15]MDO7841533.1 OmpA family protein [Sphingomonas sp. CA1-15]